MRNSDWPFPAAPTQTAGKVVMYAGAALGIYLLYKLATVGVVGATAAITRGAADAAAGVVVGAGEAVGIPQTNQDKCVEAIYAGRTWDASFACPAATFIRYLGGVLPPRPDTVSEGLSGPWRAKRLAGRRMLNRNC